MELVTNKIDVFDIKMKSLAAAYGVAYDDKSFGKLGWISGRIKYVYVKLWWHSTETNDKEVIVVVYGKPVLGMNIAQYLEQECGMKVKLELKSDNPQEVCELDYYC